MMMNSALLDSIENELIQNTEPSYQKIIPIKNYSYETKKTLDFIVEKYGGFINRFDDKIIIFIHDYIPTTKETILPIHDETRYSSLKFEKLNSSMNQLDERLALVEEKVGHYIEEQNKYSRDKNNYLQSYMSYFRTNESKKEAIRLIEEIINHH